MSKEKKRIEMSEKIEDLIEKNAEYFRGKELLFDNQASYIQCIADPAKAGGFIAVQKRLQAGDNQQTTFVQELVPNAL